MRVLRLRYILLLGLSLGMGLAATLMFGTGEDKKNQSSYGPYGGNENRAILELSAQELQFGEIELSGSGRQILQLTNKGDVSIRVSGIGVTGPFRLIRGFEVLPPGESRFLSIAFYPWEEGVAEGLLILEASGSKDGYIEIALGGIGLSQVFRQAPTNSPGYEDVQLASLELDEARNQQDFSGSRYSVEQVVDSSGDPLLETPTGVLFPEKIPGVSVETKIAAKSLLEDDPGGNSSSQPGAGNQVSTQAGIQGRYIPVFGAALTVNQAFFDQDSTNPEPNQIPLKEAHFPPVDSSDDSEEGEPTQGTADDGTDDEVDDSQPALPRLVIDSNAQLFLGGQAEQFPYQVLGITVVEETGGWKLSLNERVTFPEVEYAFGQVMRLEQWGDAEGFLSSSGEMNFNLTVRLVDTNGAVIDIPLKLTTTEAIGLATSQTGVFVTGSPWDSGSGTFDLVEIQNIPHGFESAVEGKPLIIKISGRLENLTGSDSSS